MVFWKNLNNKGRILLLLMVSLILLNTIVLVTTYSLKSLSHSFTSILNDRLIPSTEIAEIQGYCYKNRLMLEGVVFNSSSKDLANLIARNNQHIDSTFAEFRRSYFTEEESLHAESFTKVLAEYRQQEQEMLSMLDTDAYAKANELFYGKSQETFQAMIEELQVLSNIQMTVGKMLYADTGQTIMIIKSVAYTSLIISIMVAAQLLVVLGIRSTSKFDKR